VADALDQHRDYAHPVDVRFVAQEDALLSWAQDGPRAVFSVPDDATATYDSVLADLETLFIRHGGLPHWGKEHTATNTHLRRAHPGFADFCAIRQELDPHGLFLNAHLAGLFA
jgi:FAD/FMN-containing dehydrogenase